MTDIEIFEEYIESLVDRRIFQRDYPESQVDFEDRNVNEARRALLRALNNDKSTENQCPSQ